MIIKKRNLSKKNIYIIPIYLGKTINYKDHLEAFKYFFNNENILLTKTELKNNFFSNIKSIFKISSKNKKVYLFIVGPSSFDLIIVLLAKIVGINTIIYIHEPNSLKILNLSDQHKKISIFFYQNILFRVAELLVPSSLTSKSELTGLRNVYENFIPLPFTPYKRKQKVDKKYDFAFISRKLPLNKGIEFFIEISKIFPNKNFVLFTSKEGLKLNKKILDLIPKNIVIKAQELSYDDLCLSLLESKAALVLPSNTTQSAARSLFWNLGIPLITTNSAMAGFEDLAKITLIIDTYDLENIKKDKDLQNKIINFSNIDFYEKDKHYKYFVLDSIKKFIKKIN